MAKIDTLLSGMEAADASDLHLKVGLVPRFRIHGDLEEVEGVDPLSKEDVERLTREILTDEQERMYLEDGEIDFSYGHADQERFRVNYFQEYRGPAAVFRRIPVRIPSLAELNLPDILKSFTELRGGLVLITGATGSGKTSTMASLLDIINTQQQKHIITLEDPIEYLHENKKSVVHQRGLHYDITDFVSGIKGALRQDPDVLLIGEMRDVETIRLALTAAEVGILIFATLHTNGAAASVDRIIDVFSAEEQPQIRAMLSQSLVGVASQILLRRLDRYGRVPATELLIGTPALGNMIREGKIQEITTIIQSNKALGMHTMDDSLEQLVMKRIIDPEDAYAYADNKSRFEKIFESMNISMNRGRPQSGHYRSSSGQHRSPSGTNRAARPSKG